MGIIACFNGTRWLNKAICMKSKGLYLFKILGIKVKLDYSWFLIFGLIIFSLGQYYFPQQYPDISPTANWIISVLSALLLFVSVLLHELSHSVVAQRHGIEINNIVLFFFGGVAQMKMEPEEPATEFKVAIAGPICSLVLGVLFLGSYYGLSGSIPAAAQAVLWYIGYLNMALVAFNMIPGFPLDGGRVARAALWHYKDDLRQATKVVSNIGKGFAFVIIGLGLLNIFGGNWFGGLFFIFLGMFLKQAADRGYRMIQLREGLSGVEVGDVMSSNPVTVSSDLTLDTLIDDYFYEHQVDSFPVVNGTLQGMISTKDVKSVSRENWQQTEVCDVMDDREEIRTLQVNDDAFEVLRQMGKLKTGRLPVLDGDELKGIVTRSDIAEFVEMRDEIEA